MYRKSKAWIVAITVLAVLVMALPAFSSAAGGRGFSQNLLATDLPDLPEKIFLPLNLNFSRQSYSVSGQVVDENRQPLSGVELVNRDGAAVVTGADGRYELKVEAGSPYAIAPEKEGYYFTPALVQGDEPQAEPLDFTAVTACSDIMVNGGFETDAAWQLPITPWPAGYSTAAAHTGVRSLRTGLYSTTSNVYSYSSARQLVTIPDNAASATLRLWLYPLSTESTFLPLSAELPTGTAIDSAVLSSDLQYVLVLDPGSDPDALEDDVLLETLLWQRRNDGQWMFHEFNLARYIGKTIKIQVGTFNDGYGGQTSMFVDDVALEYCDSGTIPGPTPTPAPTATPAPTPVPPAGCVNYFGNSDFEALDGWGIPITTYPASYSFEQSHSGVQSMRTGITNPTANRYSYSDAFQTVAIPSSATSALLDMWIYPRSSEVSSLALPPEPTGAKALDLFEDATLASDMQYILVLDQYGTILDTLYWQRSNSQAWTNLQFDLTRYRGRTIRIQYGTYNDGGGGITSMFVDDAFMYICTTTVPTSTPVPTAIPGPTPTPGACTERIDNGGFETTSSWGIPITAFTAGYSTEQAHTGTRSMRTGILFSAHNRFSYSDAYQTVSIPSTATSANLTLYTYSSSGEVASLALAEKPTATLLQSEALAGDVQYVLILDAYGNWIDTLLWQRSNTQTWTLHSFDLSGYRGRTIRIQFGTYNDGWNGVTSMFVDDVSLQTCP